MTFLLLHAWTENLSGASQYLSTLHPYCYSLPHTLEVKKSIGLQFVREHVNLGPWGQVSQCVPNSGTGRFVCELGSVRRCLHFDREFAFTFSAPNSLTCFPAAVRWSLKKKRSQVGSKEYRLGQNEKGHRRGVRKLAKGSFQSVSLADASQQRNARSLLLSLFCEVFPLSRNSVELSGPLSDCKVGPSAVVEGHEGDRGWVTKGPSGSCQGWVQFRRL